MNRPKRHKRRGAVLLLVLFLMAITAPIVGMLLDAHTTHIRATHNHIEGMTALYVAEAGVQDALAELYAHPAWRDGFTDKTFADGIAHSYTVTVEDIGGGSIRVTSTGQTAGGYAKTVIATLSGF